MSLNHDYAIVNERLDAAIARFSAFAASSVVNDNPASVTAPGASGLGGGTKKSNLDKSGFSIVKRGVTVSYQSLHFRVNRVRLGFCYGQRMGAFGGLVAGHSFLASCSSVYVVRP